MAAIPRDMRFNVLKSVVTHWGKARFGPTVEEIRQDVGLSHRSSVQWHINSLIRDGYLQRVPRKHRALEPTRRGEKLVKLLAERENETTS